MAIRFYERWAHSAKVAAVVTIFIITMWIYYYVYDVPPTTSNTSDSVVLRNIDSIVGDVNIYAEPSVSTEELAEVKYMTKELSNEIDSAKKVVDLSISKLSNDLTSQMKEMVNRVQTLESSEGTLTGKALIDNKNKIKELYINMRTINNDAAIKMTELVNKRKELKALFENKLILVDKKIEFVNNVLSSYDERVTILVEDMKVVKESCSSDTNLNKHRIEKHTDTINDIRETLLTLKSKELDRKEDSHRTLDKLTHLVTEMQDSSKIAERISSILASEIKRLNEKIITDEERAIIDNNRIDDIINRVNNLKISTKAKRVTIENATIVKLGNLVKCNYMVVGLDTTDENGNIIYGTIEIDVYDAMSSNRSILTSVSLNGNGDIIYLHVDINKKTLGLFDTSARTVIAFVDIYK